MYREAIRDIVTRHTPHAGVSPTPFEGMDLFRVEAPVKRSPGVYAPSLCVVISGQKRAFANEALHIYDENHFMLATMPTPVFGEAPEASPETPVIGLLLRLDTGSMSRLVLDVQATLGATGTSSGSRSGFGVVARDEGFDAALAHLLALMDDPPAAQILGAGRLRELLFALLRGDAGDRLRRDFGGAPAMASTLRYVHDNLSEDFSIDTLARRAGMSRAAFDRQFKAATASSPLQYVKALRLNEASMRIAQGLSIGDAAEAVGYHNPSQFSREFRRKFGQSPREWAREVQAPVARARERRRPTNSNTLFTGNLSLGA